MQLKLLKSKLHLAAVTGSDLNYHGSLTIDPDLMDAVGPPALRGDPRQQRRPPASAPRPMPCPERRGGGQIELNGAMARLGAVGDRLIVMAFALLEPAEVADHTPRVVAPGRPQPDRRADRLRGPRRRLSGTARAGFPPIGEDDDAGCGQILFTLPVVGLPIFGYGLMLFLAFLGSMNLAAWRARREKLDPEIDLRPGPLGLPRRPARRRGCSTSGSTGGPGSTAFWDVFKIWEGGIVFYGSILGGAVGLPPLLARPPLPPPADDRRDRARRSRWGSRSGGSAAS